MNSLIQFNQFLQTRSAELVEAWGDVVPTQDPDLGYGVGSSGRLQRSATTLYDRTDGRFLPVYQTEFDLAVIRAMGRTLAQVSPNLVGAVRNLCNYTIGEGFTFTASRDDTATCTDEQAEPLVKAVQREINCLLDDIGFVGSFDREIHNSAVEDGEVLLHIKQSASGKVRVYRREPDELRQPLSTRELEDWIEATYGTPCSEFVSSWSFGVHTRADQPDEPLGYHCVSDETGANWEYVPASRMVHIKRNVPRNAKRGFSDFYPVEPDSVRGEKLRRNMAEGAAVQSSIAFVRQHVQGTTRTGVDTMLGGNQQATGGTQSSRSTTGASPAAVKYRPGTIVDLSAGLEYKPGPMGSDRANDFMVVANYVQRTQAVRWSMPEYMFTGDASNANYSSTLVAESPFVKSCEAEQRFYSQHFKAMLWKVLQLRWELGAFQAFGLSWDAIEQSIEINVQTPTVATRDPKSRAEAAQLEIQSGYLSPKTACEESGRDWDVEQANGLTPQTPAGEQGATAPGTGPDGEPVPPAGGEHLGLNLQQITRIGKATDQIVTAFRAGTMDAATARMRLDALGTPASKIDLYLDADPNNDPVADPVTEAIDGEVVPQKTPSKDVPKKLPTREELAAQVAAAMSELIEDLRDAVLKDNKPRQREITKEIDELQQSAGFASRVLGMVGPFDPTLIGASPDGKLGDAAVIKPEESANADS